MNASVEQVTIAGNVWFKKYLDDRSGFWFEITGAFGELIVEDNHDQKGFSTYWWPPHITCGEPVSIGLNYRSRKAAMKAGVAYIKQLGDALATTAT